MSFGDPPRYYLDPLARSSTVETMRRMIEAAEHDRDVAQSMVKGRDAEIERLRARLAEAEELLREWLDDCCPWTHTELFLNSATDRENERLRAHIQQQSDVILDVINEREEAVRLLRRARAEIEATLNSESCYFGGDGTIDEDIDAFLADREIE